MGRIGQYKLKPAAQGGQHKLKPAAQAGSSAVIPKRPPPLAPPPKDKPKPASNNSIVHKMAGMKLKKDKKILPKL